MNLHTSFSVFDSLQFKGLHFKHLAILFKICVQWSQHFALKTCPHFLHLQVNMSPPCSQKYSLVNNASTSSLSFMKRSYVFAYCVFRTFFMLSALFRTHFTPYVLKFVAARLLLEFLFYSAVRFFIDSDIFLPFVNFPYFLSLNFLECSNDLLFSSSGLLLNDCTCFFTKLSTFDTFVTPYLSVHVAVLLLSVSGSLPAHFEQQCL